MPDDRTTDERTDAQVEADARLVGWQPENEFPGDKAKWKPAREFLQMAESQLPMARATNRRLEATNQELIRRLRAQETAIAGMKESLEALKEFHSSDTKRKVEEARAKLLEELKTARTAGDVDAEADILDALTQAQVTTKEEEKKPEPTESAAESPDWKAWRADNPKFQTDKKWRGVSIGIGEEMRADPAFNHLVGRAFYDEVTRQTDAWFAEHPAAPRRTEKSEAGGSAGGNGAGSAAPRGKSYAQLPPDAKTQCEKDAKKHVGKDPAFKTLADWQSYYAKVYWENE
jgi:hypothetical protein